MYVLILKLHNQEIGYLMLQVGLKWVLKYLTDPTQRNQVAIKDLGLGLGPVQVHGFIGPSVKI